MPEIDDSWLVPNATAEPPLKKFAPDEMLTCKACLRANAPTRAQCMYCGAALNETAALPEAETPAATHIAGPSFCVVIEARDGQPIDSAAAQLAPMFNLKPEELRLALGTRAPFPLVSTTSHDEATRIIGNLNGTEVKSAVVSTSDGKTDFVPVHIRALELDGDNVTAIAKVGRQRLASRLGDIQLIVTGRLLMHRVEVDERRARNSVKPLDRRELSEDQAVVDLYRQSSDSPWRIVVNDFDFSCLGAHKGLTAFDNVKALIESLKDQTRCEVNDSYGHLRPLLNNIWPLQNTASESRSRRPRASRHDFSTVTASDNETQFNNYSRLVWLRRRAPPVDGSK